jgi:hypothetical protein
LTGCACSLRKIPVDHQEQTMMRNLNELNNDQLAELAERHQLIGGFGRIGPLYVLYVEDEEIEFDSDAAARFLRGMLRAYRRWEGDAEEGVAPAVLTDASFSPALN